VAFIPQPPVFTWSGIYIGGNGGYSFGTTTPSLGGLSGAGFSTNGIIAGGTIGGNYQARAFVFGVEGGTASVNPGHITCKRIASEAGRSRF
jgi:outer membrane immunogenic protein